MADDLANDWGVQFCLTDSKRRSVHSPVLPRVLVNGQDSFTTIAGLVATESDKFIFERLAVSGSQANSWCVDDATNHTAELCLFAAGSFAAGDSSALQSFASSQHHVGDDLSFVSTPDEVLSAGARRNTVALPCHIPGAMDLKKLKKCEDDCLEALHIRLCWAKMSGKPHVSLFLELILAGNGASLSNRTLVALGKLAKHHGLGVIVDEIVTGGCFWCCPSPRVFKTR